MKGYLALIGAACLMAACNKVGLCPAVIYPGPAVVTIDCVDAARADDLAEEELRVEYSSDGEEWQSCMRYAYEDHTDAPVQQPVCANEGDFAPKFECGASITTDSEEISFYIRAAQGARSAGPIQITTRSKQCGYDQATLYHELHLDYAE